MTWVVAKTGVYLQDVHGPFLTEYGARIAAQELALTDTDDYHDWVVSFLSVPAGLTATDYSYRGRGMQGNDFREATLQDKALNKAGRKGC